MTQFSNPFALCQLGAMPAADAAAFGTRLGAKAAQLCGVAGLSLPVPAGFVVPIEACRGLSDGLPTGLMQNLDAAVAALEARTGRVFGGKDKPLLLSVRPSAPLGVPSSVEAVLNLSLIHISSSRLMAQPTQQRKKLNMMRGAQHSSPRRAIASSASATSKFLATSIPSLKPSFNIRCV